MDTLNLNLDNPNKTQTVNYTFTESQLSLFINAIFLQTFNKAKDLYDPNNNPDILYTPDEFAAILKVSKTTLWKWDKKGILKPLKIANEKRYRLSQLDDFEVDLC